MYVICVLFDNLSNIHMYCLCTVYLSSSWRSLWPLQQLAWILWCQQYRLLWVPHLCRHFWRLPRILCLLSWLFSLIFAVSHMRMCALTPAVGSRDTLWPVATLRLLPLHFTYAQSPQSLTPQMLGPPWAVVPSSSCWHSKYMCTQRREPPHPGRVWNGVSREHRTDCADEVQDRTRQTEPEIDLQATHPCYHLLLFSYLWFLP